MKNATIHPHALPEAFRKKSIQSQFEATCHLVPLLPSLVTINPSKTQMVFYLFQVAAFERQVLCHAPWSGGFGVVGAGRDARDMCKAEDVKMWGWMWEKPQRSVW